MSKEKRKLWLPPVGLLLAFIAATVCNIGATADPAGENPALNIGMTALYVAAWVLFFIFFKSKSKAMYIVSLVYWLILLLFAVINLPGIDVGAYIPTETPFVLVPMALIAPMMGLLFSDFIYYYQMLSTLLYSVICAGFTAWSIYKIAKR